MLDLAALMLACAPAVHPVTMQALVAQESSGHPYAIGVNGEAKLPRAPRSREEAVQVANRLLAAGVSADFGIAQINSKNLAWLGLDAESVFDPCANLRAGQAVLLDGYRRAMAKHGPGQRALEVALSYYNTGSPDRGIENGYVDKVKGRVVVPALEPAIVVKPVPRAGQKPPAPAPQGRQAFGSPDREAFGSDGREAFGLEDGAAK
jgi:type IV secretion system protein VirB1